MNYKQYIGKTYELILQPKSKSEPEEVIFRIILFDESTKKFYVKIIKSKNNITYTTKLVNEKFFSYDSVLTEDLMYKNQKIALHENISYFVKLTDKSLPEKINKILSI